MTTAGNGKISDMNAAKPFLATVDAYRKALWFGTIPLPARDKFPPPTGFTGHRAPHPSPDKIEEWKNDPKHKRANIGIRLAGVTPEHEILGIDVDHYISGSGAKAKDKRGGDQLHRLETELGTLPATWISSARDDGISGIRYFRVPRGLAFKGQADKDIEVIYKGYRFAVVWPSIHPNGGQYWWYPPSDGSVAEYDEKDDATVVPNTLGDRDAWEAFNGRQIPKAIELPLLPQKWIEYLSAGGMRAEDNESIDMDISVNDLVSWADEVFNPGGEVIEVKQQNGIDGKGNPLLAPTGEIEITGLCTRVAKSVVQQKQKISEDATSHDKITELHWHIYRLASEGHIGWKAAISLLEQIWIDDVMERDKRSRAELRGEIFRSSINALRKIKAQVDQRIALGTNAVDKSCGCRGALHVIKDGDDGLSIETATGTAVSLSGNGVGGLGSGVGGLADVDDGSEGDDDVVFDFDNFNFQYAVLDDDGEIVGIKGEADDGNNDKILRWVLNGAAKSPEEYAMNDDGNAQHFYDLFSPIGTGPVLRWVEGIGWLVWCSGGTDALTGEVQQPRWVTDTDGLIRRAWWLVKRRQEMYADALLSDFQNALGQAQITGNGLNSNGNPTGALLAQRKNADSWSEFARRSGNNITANAAIEALKQKEGVTMDINAFDANPSLLGVANGVIDLDNLKNEYDDKGNDIGQTPNFREAHPDDLILLNTDVEFKRYDKCGRIARQIWENYLDTFIKVGNGGEEFLKTVQMCLGYGILGTNPERALLMIKGPSSTGKSTILNAIRAALGDYAMTANMSMYQSHKLNPVLARALSKRIVMTSELSDDDNFSAAVLKNITGNEVIAAELKGSNAIVERTPAFIPLIATNSAPNIKGADEALQRRLIVLPFDNAVEHSGEDVFASQRIENMCQEAILSWLVDGYIMWKNEGQLPRSQPKVLAAVHDTMAEFDHLLSFVDEKIIKSKQYFGKETVSVSDLGREWVVSGNHLYDNYKKWCERIGIDKRDILDMNKFGRRLKAVNFVQKQIKIDGKNMRRWCGIKINDTINDSQRNISLNFQRQNKDEEN